MAFPDQHLPLSFEPLSPMKDEIIVPDSDTEYEGYRSAAKRRRIEELGRRYIAGHEITIVSARLKGPFDGSWKNPWHKRAAQHSFQSKDVKTIHGPKQGEERLSLPSAVLGDGDPNPKSGLEKRARALGMDKERYSFGAADDCAGTKSNATLGDEPKSASKSRPAITGDLVSKAFIGYTNFQPQPEDDYKRVKKSMKRRAESWLKAVKGSAYSKGGVASPPSPASDLVESPSMFGLRPSDGQLSEKSRKPVAQVLGRAQIGSPPVKPTRLTTVDESHRASERPIDSLPTSDRPGAFSLGVKSDDAYQAQPGTNHALEPGLVQDYQTTSPRDDHLVSRASPATLHPPRRAEATSEAAQSREKVISAAVRLKEKTKAQQLPHWNDEQGPVASDVDLTAIQPASSALQSLESHFHVIPASTMLLDSRNSHIDPAGDKEEMARARRTTSHQPCSTPSDARPVAAAAFTSPSPLRGGDPSLLASGAKEDMADACILRSIMDVQEDIPDDPIGIGQSLHPDHMDPDRTPWPELSEPEHSGVEHTPTAVALKDNRTTAQELQTSTGGPSANGSKVQGREQPDGLQAPNNDGGMEDEPSISTQTALANMQRQFQVDIQTPRTTAPKSPRTALTGQETDAADDERNLISTQALFDAASPFAFSTIKKKYQNSRHGQPIHHSEKAPLTDPDHLLVRPDASPGKETPPVLNNQQSAAPTVNGVGNTSDVAPQAVGAGSNESGVDGGEATMLEAFSGSDIDAVMDDIRDTLLAKWDLDAELKKEAASRTSPSAAAGSRGGSERLRSYTSRSRL